MFKISDVKIALQDCYKVEVVELNRYANDDKIFFGVKEFSPMGDVDMYVLYSIGDDLYNEYGTIIYTRD